MKMKISKKDFILFFKKVIKYHEYFGYSAISKFLRNENML